MTIENLAVIVESVTGADPLRAGRARSVVDSRVLLVVALRRKGWTQKQVADALGFNHTTIHHYEDIFRDAMKYPSRPEVVFGWKKLSKILDL